ncbi:MAG TPA: hypothetical protein VGE35_02610 [Candidatus Paceibacterota bacterium]
MGSLRTEMMVNKYKEYQKANPSDGSCPLCSREPLKAYSHWKIIDNKFPYDIIATTHHMVVPLRHVVEAELTEAELKEFESIKTNFINPGYNYIIEATPLQKSIPGHFHLHLIIAK